MKFGVVVFPGSNCDRDLIHVLEEVMQREVRVIWHKEKSLEGFDSRDCIMLPGGFSYGDYLRAGAIARFSPVMPAVTDFANSGGFVWGICNGFQVLCEAGLLPGALLRNRNQQFVCKNIYITPGPGHHVATASLEADRAYMIPIAHAEGRFYAPEKTLDELERNGQVLFRYCNVSGEVTPEANPNGSMRSIAGVTNAAGNVLGLMPHPERAAEEILGNVDGRFIFDSFIRFVEKQEADVLDDLLR